MRFASLFDGGFVRRGLVGETEGIGIEVKVTGLKLGATLFNSFQPSFHW